MPKLDVAGMVDRMHDAGFQTSAPGFTKSGLGPSCDYCIDLAIRDGSHKEVEWSADLWIVLLFFQKKGRTVVAEFDGATYKKGDALQALRPLCDYQVLNSAIAAKIPAYWKEFCPTVEGMRSLFPWWCTMLCVHDCANAFHSVLLSEIEANQVAVSDGSTVFERTRGVKALSNEELMAGRIQERFEDEIAFDSLGEHCACLCLLME